MARISDAGPLPLLRVEDLLAYYSMQGENNRRLHASSTHAALVLSAPIRYTLRTSVFLLPLSHDIEIVDVSLNVCPKYLHCACRTVPMGL